MKNKLLSEKKVKEISILACEIAGIDPFYISYKNGLAAWEEKKQLVIGHIAIQLAIAQSLKNEST